jgi:hypothetical protein
VIEAAHSQPIRVVVADLSGLLTDIVTDTLEAAPDIAVTVASASEALAVDADVAVVQGPPAGLPALGRELLGLRPRMQVVAVRCDGQATSLYELRPHERKLGEISPEALLDAVRSVRR